jgi:hypothetical protein
MTIMENRAETGTCAPRHCVGFVGLDLSCKRPAGGPFAVFFAHAGCLAIKKPEALISIRAPKRAATSTAGSPFAFLWRNSPATVANVTQFLTAEIIL